MTAVATAGPWVPKDTLAVRLAAIRVALGEMSGGFAWNVKRAASFCGIDPGSWRNWEAGKRPQDYESVCRKIADATGCDLEWLMRGGPLPNPLIRWNMEGAGQPELTSVAIVGQVELPFPVPRELALVGAT